jgi:hypothetical protein
MKASDYIRMLEPGGDIKAVVDTYIAARANLQVLRKARFPTGSWVHVSAKRYDGPGKVVSDSHCPATQLPVELENGNVWYYDLTDCTPTMMLGAKP